MRERRPLPIALAAAALFSIAVFAQTNKWYDPYQKGVKAFESKSYQAAATLLEQAVAVDPKASANKYVEGVFRTDYFPYYYLGAAYLELRQYDKAQLNFTKAKDGLPRELVAKLTTLQARLTSETAPVVIARGNSTEPPKPPAVNPAFEPVVRQADAAFAARRFSDAVAGFDSARNLDAAEYAKENIQVRRDEASRGVDGQKLAEDGRQALQASQLNAAKAKFQQADQTLSGQKAVADGLAEIKQREDNYQKFKASAEQDIRDSNFQAARDKLDQARTAHRERFTADGLDARATLVNDKLKTPPVVPPIDMPGGNRQGESQHLFAQAKLMASQGNYAGADKEFAAALSADPKNQAADQALQNSKRFATLRAQGTQFAKNGNNVAAQERLIEARSLDPARFQSEGLTATLDRLLKQTNTEPDKVALRSALLALFQGNAQLSINILEPAINGRSADDKNTFAALHAYLGVAYATQALSAPKPADQTALRDKALEHFRLAISAQRDYQLAGRIVSPKIVTLFEQARVG